MQDFNASPLKKYCSACDILIVLYGVFCKDDRGEMMSVMIHAAIYQQTGLRNIRAKKPCGDVVFFRETSDFLFYALADGQSNKSHGYDGGMVVLNCIANYIQNIGISKMLSMPFLDEIPFLLTREFRKALLSVAQQQDCLFTEYASTVLAVAIDPISGDYLLIHLGDGCIVGIQSNNSDIILSPPENVFSQQHTWFTTSDFMLSHLHIRMGKILNLRRIILMTDGATPLCHGKNIPSRAKRILADKDPNRILESLKNPNIHDDASCIVLDVTLRSDVQTVCQTI